MAFDPISLVGSGVDAVGGIIGGLFNANQAKKNRQWAEHMYERQVEDNIKFWNMQNEYNLPSAVYQRQLEGMRQNGLNPLLMYGDSGISSVGTAQQAPQSAHPGSGSAAHADFKTNFGQAIQQATLLKAQLDNLQKDSDLKESQSIAEIAKAKNYEADSLAKTGARMVSDREAMLKKQAYEIREETRYDEVLLARLNREYQQGLVDMQPDQREELRQKINVLAGTYDKLYTEISNENRITDQTIAKMKNEMENANKQTAAVVANLSAQAREAKARAISIELDNYIKKQPEYQQAMLNKAKQEVVLMIQQGNQLEVQSALDRWTYELLPKKGTPAYDAVRTTKNLQPVISTIYGGYNMITGRDMLGTVGSVATKIF